jgi:hypothetical protein
MPAPKKAKSPDMCPNCYLFEQKDEPLIFRPGSDLMHRCGRGHRYEDVDALQNLTMQMIRKKEAIEVAANPPAPSTEPAAPLVVAAPTGIQISQDDQVRIQSILGKFTDSSSLFGMLYALNEELKEAKDQIATLKMVQQAAKMSPGASGPTTSMNPDGNMVIQTIIPEQYVQPLIDIAEANAMDVVTYFNSVIDNALPSGWFF